MKIKEDKYKEIDDITLELIELHDKVQDQWYEGEYEELLKSLDQLSKKAKDIMRLTKRWMRK